VVRLRETSGEGAGDLPFFTCNNDRPYAGQARCLSDQWPTPPPGPVLIEEARDVVVSELR
jgi:hypothetical protein